MKNNCYNVREKKNENLVPAVLFLVTNHLCLNTESLNDHQSLVSGLKELFQSSAVVLKQDYFKGKASLL